MKRHLFRSLIPLVNGEKSARLANLPTLPLVNAYSLEDSDWWTVPFGDVPYDLTTKSGERIRGVQRLDKPSAERMVGLFNSWRGKLKRRFGGLPIFVGHPDYPEFANEGEADNRAYGWISDLEVGTDCLRLKVDLGDAGKQLLANKHYKWFSPFWLGREVAPLANGMKVFELVWLNSCGLTNQPRWPVAALVNETDDPMGLMEMAQPESDAATTTPEETPMDLLTRLLAVIGIDTVKSEDDVVNFIATLKAAVAKAREAVEARWKAESLADQVTRLENSSGELDAEVIRLIEAESATVTKLVNARTAAETRATELATQNATLAELLKVERAGRVELFVNSLITGAKILPADREATVAELCGATPEVFATRCTELANAAPVLKTEPKTTDLGSRNSTEQKRGDQVVALVNAYRSEHKCDWDTAWHAVKAKQPALFENGK